MMINSEKKLQELLLMIAMEIKRICEKHNIPYFIDGGTQLGAVRHKGFIPWDDDLDIAMKRSDYEKFLKVCSYELDRNIFFIQNEWTEENYAFSFTKIQLLGTELLEDFSKNVSINHSIFVDIFPYDNLPNSKIKKKLFLLKNHIIKNLLWTKCGYGTEKHRLQTRYKIFKLLSGLFTVEYLKKKRNKLITKYNSQTTELCFTSDYPKTMILNKWFQSSKLYSFENQQLSGFLEADELLTTLYGDYMKLPPQNERRKHSQYEVKFGPYSNIS